MLLKFKDNQTAHNDLLFTFNGRVKKCDSYYFALDRNLGVEEENPEKIRKVLKRLLEQWLESVNISDSGSFLYLPYDFSDEYVGCLRCEVSDSFLLLTDGYLNVGGYCYFPSDVGELIKTNSDFTATDQSSVEIHKQEFTRQLKENIENV